MANLHRWAELDQDGNFHPKVLERLRTQFGGALSAASTTLATQLGHPRPAAPLATDLPAAFTGSTTGTLPGSAPTLDASTMATHPAASHNLAFSRLDSGLAPLEFVFDGTELEVQYTATNGYGTDTEISVDGRRLSETPLNIAGASTNNNGFIYLRWDTARPRRIRIVNHGAALRFIRVGGHGQEIYPVTSTPTVGILTDSFGGATTYVSNFEAFPTYMERALNVNLVRSVVGGSGYTNGGQINQNYRHPTRIALIGRSPLDGLVFFGSLNDAAEDANGTYRAAVRATWDAYAAAHPGVPFVVFGIQPSGASSVTDPKSHTNNRVLHEEAVAHPQVVAFVDMLGTAKTGTVPPAWSATATYSNGDLVHHLGAIYRCNVAPGSTLTGNNTPNGSRTHWGRTSWVFTGTGNSGTTTGNGNRDVLLGADGVHPTAKGNYGFGHLMADALVKVLTDPQPFTYHNV